MFEGTNKGILYIIAFFSFLIFSIINLYEKEIFFSLIILITLNIVSIIWFLKKKYTQTYIIYIYFIYNILILKLPVLWIIFKYQKVDILYYLNYRNIDTEQLFYASLYIFLFDLLLIFFLLFFLKKEDTHNFEFNKFYLLNINKFFIITFLLVLSYLSKIYLVSTGVWFFYLMNDIDTTRIPFYTVANIFEKLDLFVLLYFVYKFKIGILSKKEILITILIFTFSMFFAIISTSKLKILILFLPLILTILYMKKRVIPILVLLIIFPVFSTLFNAMTYIRHNPNKTISEAIISSQKEENRFNAIYNDKLIGRLDYQTVIANVLRVYPAYPREFKFDYLNNIIGLIPRIFWNSKPVISMNMNKIGYEIGYVHYSDKFTSIGITPLGIAYYQMGLFGLPFISFFTAVFLSFFSNRLNTKYWIGFILSIMIAITLARNGTYINIIPDLILVIIPFFITAILTASKFNDEIKIPRKKN
jgi:hypothetical protein